MPTPLSEFRWIDSHIRIRSAERETCTFTPRLSESTQRIIDRSYGQGERGTDASQRLFSESQKLKAKREKLISKYVLPEFEWSKGLKVSGCDRLVFHCRHKSEEEEAMKRECTFRPSIPQKSSNMIPTAHTMRYTKPTAAFQSSIHDHIPDLDKECEYLLASKLSSSVMLLPDTFKPKTNDVRRSMRSAAEYLQTDVVERLSKPAPTQDAPQPSPSQPHAAYNYYIPPSPTRSQHSPMRNRRRSNSSGHMPSPPPSPNLSHISTASASPSRVHHRPDAGLAIHPTGGVDASWFTYVPIEERVRRASLQPPATPQTIGESCVWGSTVQ